jgi:ribosomal protein S18 acetylase RimI-like enzyme
MNNDTRYQQVAMLHVANINQGFLATLGNPFLERMYRAIDETGESVLLTEECDGRVVGFVSGSSGMGPIYRRMLRRPLSLAWALLPGLLRPTRCKRIIEIMLYGQNKHDSLLQPLPQAELLSIAVDPAARGSGVGERLYRRLEEHFRERGVSSFRITVGDALLPAHRFYRRMGAKPVGRTQVHAGEESVVYVQDLV